MKKDTQHIDAILNATQNMQRANAPDFLYTRLQNKLAAHTAQSNWVWWQQPFVQLHRPSFAITALLLFVALNVGALWLFQTNATANSLQSFATEYNLHLTTNYNY